MKGSFILLAFVVLISCNDGGTIIEIDPNVVKLDIIDTSFFRPSRLTSLNNSLIFLDEDEEFLLVKLERD